MKCRIITKEIAFSNNNMKRNPFIFKNEKPVPLDRPHKMCAKSIFLVKIWEVEITLWI